MWAPEPFFQHATILLASQHSFCSAYLAQALSMFGLRTIGPFDSETELQALLDAAPPAPAAIIVAADWLRDGAGTLHASLEQFNVPFILVENAPWRSVSSPLQPAFIWPYAAFQIVEALQEAVARSMGLISPAQIERQGS
ncbi:hypothetical protein SAMN03159338_3818 [Sphingomonas sp. NFR04]|uniref:hypothetical protein n=1 Tax=Sphingomonas sp. NFR04 TaxID=1566283 RepID=UPI0008E73DFF|nr:hypothetical protein [Sphingomonas sp. NFR04]SFK27991.1 hypothetical protein SAMN03159338_3818 [Sphingomonas sp. NFR04]